MQRQLTLKIVVILLLSIILLIPLNMIAGQIRDRSGYLYSVQQDIAASWTRQQQVMAPVLVQPYQVFGTDKKQPLITRYLLIPAKQVRVLGDVRSHIRARGIYRVPVYTAQLQVTGHLPHQLWHSLRQQVTAQQQFESFQAPYLAMHLSDPRGIGNDFKATLNGRSVELIPGAGLATLATGFRMMMSTTELDSQQDVDFTLQFELRGMVALGFIPAAEQINLRLRSDWQHPKFSGAFLPLEHSIDNAGFSASWSVNEFSSGIKDKLQRCQAGSCDVLLGTALGVEFFQPVDVYQQAERAVKYGVLFIAISFVSFFIFEVLTGLPIHPIQYTLVGLALAIFYLLLISLSEHFAFYWAYLIATLACALLLLAYTSHVFASPWQARLYSLCLVVLHAMLYVILQMEDFALLMSTLLLFSLLALLMLATRNVNWYKLPDGFKPGAQQGDLFKKVI